MALGGGGTGWGSIGGSPGRRRAAVGGVRIDRRGGRRRGDRPAWRRQRGDRPVWRRRRGD